jgi:uncharacterized repeat protein (TIGR01451 family)
MSFDPTTENTDSTTTSSSTSSTAVELTAPELAVAVDQADADYAPGELVGITASNVAVGGSVQFTVAHVDAGADGIVGTADDGLLYDLTETGTPWIVVDGGVGDLDGVANGVIQTSWYVNQDAAGQAFQLTAADQASGDVATASFTDAAPVQAIAHTTFNQTIWNAEGNPGTGSTGSGLIKSFVRGQDTGNEQSYNTDGTPQFDTSGGTWTHSITLAEIPVVTIGGVQYREFRLDTNENNNATDVKLSLDAFQLWASSNPSQTNFVAPNLTTGTGGNLPGATQVYNLDGSGDTWLELTDWNSGSGKGDYKIDIPESYFSSLTGNPFIYLYSAFGNQGGTYSTDGGFEEWYVITIPNPGIDIAKTAVTADGDTTVNSATDDVTYTITVTNTGNVDLTNVAVTDQIERYSLVSLGVPGSPGSGVTIAESGAGTHGNGTLNVGETWTYTLHYDVTQADINAEQSGNLLIHNDAAVTATSNSGNVSDSAFADVGVAFQPNPALDITKAASVAGGSADAGEAIQYAITVANTGNVTLTGVTVTDPYADAGSIVRGADVVGDGDNLLEVGETWGYTAAHTVTQAEIDSNGGGDGKLENTATADSNETGPDTASADVPVHYNPDVSIDKTATIADGHADQAGDIINYTVKVANTGNVTLSNVDVNDSFEGQLAVDLTNSNTFNPVTHTGNTFNDPNGNGVLDPGETWTYTYQHVVTQNELNTRGVDFDGTLDNTATVTTTAPDLGPLSDDASVPILLGPGVRTPGFWSQTNQNTNWTKFWDGIVGNEPNQAGTNGFPGGEITLAVTNSLGDHRVDTNGDGQITNADNAPTGKITAGLLIGDINLDGIADNGEHAVFISTADALTILNASQKVQQNAEYQEARALVATWLNYLEGNPITASDPTKVDAQDAIEWGVDWLVKATQQTDGNVTIADMAAKSVAASSAAWNVGFDGTGDANTTPTAYAQLPLYNPTGDIPGGNQILGVLDEYNNHGTVYGVQIATTP